ncbi:hypothetical protein KP509_12G059900 [Ceratopteris richardii]|uniref:AP2/ERF domain-containing protein n=1 Tax=Ceratopteris richardii TaxID=49495 RepID=A0A8T2TSM2_CERRI|nr:hypothetical protein KP509_12G059900 [Ceratopteris richardii]
MVATVERSSKLRKSNSSPTDSFTSSSRNRFKGVRMRSWGKWVSEIRLPNCRDRLWLGSFSSAEQAARAFDVAFVCLRGRSEALNFPDSPPAYAPPGLPHHKIVELAKAAGSDAPSTIHSESSSRSEISSRTEYTPSRTSNYAMHSGDSAESRGSAPSSPISSTDSDSIASSSTESQADSLATSPFSFFQEMDVMENLSRFVDISDALSSPSPPAISIPLKCLQQAEWEEYVWGSSLLPHSSFDQQISTFFLPVPIDEDRTELLEPSLWEHSH